MTSMKMKSYMDVKCMDFMLMLLVLLLGYIESHASPWKFSRNSYINIVQSFNLSIAQWCMFLYFNFIQLRLGNERKKYNSISRRVKSWLNPKHNTNRFSFFLPTSFFFLLEFTILILPAVCAEPSQPIIECKQTIIRIIIVMRMCIMIMCSLYWP